MWEKGEKEVTNDCLFLVGQQSGPCCHSWDWNTGGERNSWAEDEFSPDLWTLMRLWAPAESVWGASSVAQTVKSQPAMQETGDAGATPGSGRSPGGGHGNPLQYPCLIPGTEEPGRLQSMGSQRVGHDWATKHPCTHAESVQAEVSERDLG